MHACLERPRLRFPVLALALSCTLAGVVSAAPASRARLPSPKTVPVDPMPDLEHVDGETLRLAESWARLAREIEVRIGDAIRDRFDDPHVEAEILGPEEVKVLCRVRVREMEYAGVQDSLRTLASTVNREVLGKHYRHLRLSPTSALVVLNRRQVEGVPEALAAHPRQGTPAAAAPGPRTAALPPAPASRAGKTVASRSSAASRSSGPASGPPAPGLGWSSDPSLGALPGAAGVGSDPSPSAAALPDPEVDALPGAAGVVLASGTPVGTAAPAGPKRTGILPEAEGVRFVLGTELADFGRAPVLPPARELRGLEAEAFEDGFAVHLPLPLPGPGSLPSPIHRLLKPPTPAAPDPVPAPAPVAGPTAAIPAPFLGSRDEVAAVPASALPRPGTRKLPARPGPPKLPRPELAPLPPFRGAALPDAGARPRIPSLDPEPVRAMVAARAMAAARSERNPGGFSEEDFPELVEVRAANPDYPFSEEDFEDAERDGVTAIARPALRREALVFEELRVWLEGFGWSSPRVRRFHAAGGRIRWEVEVRGQDSDLEAARASLRRLGSDLLRLLPEGVDPGSSLRLRLPGGRRDLVLEEPLASL